MYFPREFNRFFNAWCGRCLEWRRGHGAGFWIYCVDKDPEARAREGFLLRWAFGISIKVRAPQLLWVIGGSPLVTPNEHDAADWTGRHRELAGYKTPALCLHFEIFGRTLLWRTIGGGRRWLRGY